MALCRVTKVENARKAPGPCQKCRVDIQIGDPYLWWKGRYTPKYVRCMKPSCYPRPWELETNNTKRTDLEGSYACSSAQEADDAPEAAHFLREAIGLAEALVEDLEERLGNKQGTALEQTSEYEALESSKDAFESWVSEAESAADDLEAVEEVTEGDEDSQVSYEEALQDLLSAIPEWPELDLGSYGPPRPKRKVKAAAVAAEPESGGNE